MSFEERYKKLNAEQKKAVDTIDGPVLVVAGPGSGKTEILSMRVANILRTTDVPAGAILCLTFTDSASVNMRERLAQLIGTDAYRVQVHTFHSFGVTIINRFPEYFFGSAEFNPSDTITQMEVLSHIFEMLPYDNPLRSEHPEQGFVFLKPALDAISHLKRAGLSAQEFREIIEHNELVVRYANPIIAEAFGDRLSKKDFSAIRDAALRIRQGIAQKFPVPHLEPLSKTIADTLDHALRRAEEEDKTSPLSEWKSSWTTVADGERVLKDTERLPRFKALADVYDQYQQDLYALGYYDFDDMLLQTIHVIEKTPSLALELQEEYQYLLVDEFQDTNDAQMRLLRLLTSADVHEGRPNILAVGDDDQAIYKFQGAEIANILQFKEMYRDPVIITLSRNYRSTQTILDTASSIISQGTHTLAHLLPEVKKVLTAEGKGKEGRTSTVTYRQFATDLHEYQYIAREVKKQIDAGVSPKDIAIISRTHKILQDMVPYLRSCNIPISYDKQQNVLELSYIRELITVARFVSTLIDKNKHKADELLPEILSFAWWNIPRKTIWDISVRAEQEKKLWIDVMQSYSDTHIQRIGEFLLALGIAAQSEPLERILDLIIGSVTLELPEDQDDDEFFPSPVREASLGGFVSSFRDYYFGARLAKHKGEYVTFLSGLRVFIETLREYKQGTVLSVKDLVAFVDVYEKNNISLLDTSPFMSAASAVSLLTSHKAKGLEFDVVFIASLSDDIWTSPGRGDVLPMPKNLPIKPLGDTRDDMLRLLYVALTRARQTLVLTYHTRNEKGRAVLPVQFLSHLSAETDTGAAEEHPLESAWQVLSHPPYKPDEDSMLRSLLVGYCMPVTHLNNFLDVTKGGPLAFLEQNLLRFPQAKTPSNVYGTAMHAVMHYIHTYLRREGALPSLAQALDVLSAQIIAGRLSSAETAVQIGRGEKALTLYYELRKDRLNADNKIEVDFKHQGVCLGDCNPDDLEHEGQVRLTGKIDKMIISGDHITVVDFKTGRPKLSWEEGGFEAIQLHHYKNQLMFYKLLIEHSRDYKTYTVTEGVLEFLEPYKDTLIDLPLSYAAADVERLSKIVQIVWRKIMALDFPDVSSYKPDLSGIEAFENDLLEGKV